MTPLTFITGSANKASEVVAILGEAVHLLCHALDLVEIQGTIDEITLDKCRRAAAIVDGPVLVEDTSLCFDALDGLPGPYVKWFVQSLGFEGLPNLLAAYSDKSAQFVSSFAYSDGPDHEPILFQGRIKGRIVPPRGAGRFGFDPIFEYQGRTYAEMTLAEKNVASARVKALEKFKVWLEGRSGS
ncbi:MAG: nucleoside triphosphate pyrophosphohydrolase ham1 [Phylliscum demangeonii]|nr:MAG: nucleoside triphosphate pyrophosphohydrolase ham1 [Phylliscum demangeonii]